MIRYVVKANECPFHRKRQKSRKGGHPSDRKRQSVRLQCQLPAILVHFRVEQALQRGTHAYLVAGSSAQNMREPRETSGRQKRVVNAN